MTDWTTPYHRRKAERKDYYEQYIEGWILEVCGACSGSGYYDWTNKWGRTPKCSSCKGTGKARVRGPKNKYYEIRF